MATWKLSRVRRLGFSKSMANVLPVRHRSRPPDL